MAVIGVSIKLGSWRGSFGKDPRVSFSLHVETDDPLDGPLVVRSSPLVPQVGAYYAVGNEIAPEYICRTVSPKVDGNDKCFWEVDVEYELIDPKDDEEGELNPRASKRFRFDASIRLEKQVMFQDLDGTPILNTAKEEYVQPLEQSVKILVLNISRKEYANPLVRQCRFLESVNQTPFWNCQPGQVLVESYLADGEGLGNRTSGWNVKYSIAIRPKNAGRWDEIEVPSMGYNEIKDGKLKEIINPATGKTFGTEQYLDADGKWKDRLESGFQPHYTTYRIRVTENFGLLYLPNLSSLVYSQLLDEEES